MRSKVANVGSGISGLVAAHALQGHADVTLLEAGDHFGDHAHTVDVTFPTLKGSVTAGIDAGFLVLNTRTYPLLTAMLIEYGGANHYVEMITSRTSYKCLHSPGCTVEYEPAAASATSRVLNVTSVEVFDKFISETHSDQAPNMLVAPALHERGKRGSLRHQSNSSVLHTDATAMAQRRAAWAAWNHPRATRPDLEGTQFCRHYLLNRLQPLSWEQPVILSLNPLSPIYPEATIGQHDYSHPVFDLDAITAQGKLAAIQGKFNRHYAGAWMGYGFHEDGLKADLFAAAQLLDDLRHPCEAKVAVL